MSERLTAVDVRAKGVPDWTALVSAAARLGRALEPHGDRIVTAESCTGGLIAALITETAGSSAWFDRGFVTYSNEAKIAHLGVCEQALARQGAVSEAVVRQMALGALSASSAQLAIAVSGVAGPGGGSVGKPVGTVCLGWAFRMPESCREGRGPRVVAVTTRFPGTRHAVRAFSARLALQMGEHLWFRLRSSP